MFKVLVDATPIRGKLSGVGMYTYNLINALDQLQKQENFELGIYFQPSVKNWLSRNLSPSPLLSHYSQIIPLPIPVTLTNLLAKYPNPILSYYEKYLNQAEIIHGTDHFVYPCKTSLRVMTIHDLTFVKYPNYANSIVRTYLDRIQRCLSWTDLIITFSESTKRDIIELLNVKANQIYITPQASRYSANYLSDKLIEQLKSTIEYHFSQPYLLFVGTLEPRKNIQALITAFNYLKDKYKIEHKLVLIGQKGWKYQPIFEAIDNSTWKHHIHQLDYLSNELVALFYSQADVFIYPSYYEGFGLPILEAMTLGAPVITSNSSSLPEVAADAALLINPYEPIELADAILKVISDSQLRQKLIQKGQERAKLFTWERTAKETLKAYRSIL